MSIASNLSFIENSSGAITTGTINAPSAPITFSINSTEDGRFDSNGYLLLGYTTSQGAYRLQVNGSLYASGNIIGNITGNVTGTVSTASNIAGGTAGQIVYQTAPGLTGFTGPGTAGQLLQSNGTSAPTYVNTATLMVGISLVANTSTNIAGGTAGQVPYQTAAGQTSFIGPGTAGQILVSSGASAPTYTNTASVYVQSSVYANNIIGGTTGQLVYQSGASTTGFVGPGTAGQFLQSNGAGAPTYVNTSSMYVQRAVQADSAAGSAGSVTNALTIGSGLSGSPSSTYNGSAAITISLNTATLMASAVQVSNSLTAGTGLTGTAFNGSAPQTWTLNTATLMATSVNLTGGAAGSLLYQSAANATTSLAIGTSGYVLTSNGSAPTWTAASGVTSGNATNAANIATVAQPASGTYYPVFVSANNASATAMSEYTTSSFYINPSTGAITIAGSGSLNLNQPASVNFANGQYIKDNGAGGFIQYSGAAFQLVAANGITMGTSAYAQQSGAVLSVNGGTYYNGITTMTNSLYVTSGSVGVGTSSPTTVLHINDSLANRFAVRIQSTASNTTNAYSGIGFSGESANTKGGIFFQSLGSSYSRGNMVFALNNVTDQSDATPSQAILTLTPTGGIGFGNTPSYGTSGQVLQSNGNATPSWVSPSSLAAASSTQVTTQAQTANSTYYPVFVSANNASATAMSEYTTSSFTVNPGTGQIGIVTANSGYALSIANNPATADKLFISCTGAVNSFNIYENNTTAYLNSYASMSFRVNQLGGSGGLINFTGGNVYVGSNLGVGTNTPSSAIEAVVASTTASGYTVSTQSDLGGGVRITGNANGTTSRVSLIFRGSDSIGAGISSGREDSGTTWRTFMAFHTNNLTGTNVQGVQEKVRITSDGYVGVGTSTPVGILSVNYTVPTSAPAIPGNLGAWTAQTALFGNASSTTGQACGIGMTTSGTYISSLTPAVTWNNIYYNALNQYWTYAGAITMTLTTAGALNVANEVTAYYSDRRLKENVKPIDNAVAKVLSLNGITYNPNELAESFGFERDKDIVGLFADEVEAVLPQAVKPAPFDRTAEGGSKSGENYKTVQYEKVVPLLVEAIKEQQAQIAQLQELVKQLVNK